MIPPGQDFNPSQVSPQEKLILIFAAEQVRFSRISHSGQSDQGSNTRPLDKQLNTLTTLITLQHRVCSDGGLTLDTLAVY